MADADEVPQYMEGINRGLVGVGEEAARCGR